MKLIVISFTTFIIHLTLALLVGLIYFEKDAAAEVHHKGRTVEK